MNFLKYAAVVILSAVAFSSTASEGFFRGNSPSEGMQPIPVEDGGNEKRESPPPRKMSFKSGRHAHAYHDAFGRVASLEFSTGSQWVFVYSDILTKTPSKVVVNGKEHSLPYRPSQAKQAITEQQEYEELMRGIQENWNSYTECAVTACFGIFDGVNAAISNLASWLEVAAAVGATVGLTIAAVTGLEAEAALLAAGLYGAMAVTVVIAFAGGYTFGTVIYDNYGNVLWTSGGR